MFGPVIEGILLLLFHLVFELLFIGTGEVILYLFTLGNRQPVWRREHKESAVIFGIFLDLSFIIGFVFWLFFSWLVYNKFFA